MDGDDPWLRRVHESLLTVADGLVGTRGTREELGDGTAPLVMVAGVHATGGEVPSPLPCPLWFHLDLGEVDTGRERRVLDLRDGVLHRDGGPDGVRSIRFASLARPGVLVARTSSPRRPADGTSLPLPAGSGRVERGSTGDAAWVTTGGDGAVTMAATTTRRRVGRRWVVDRFAVVRRSPGRPAAPVDVVAEVLAARDLGVDHRPALGREGIAVDGARRAPRPAPARADRADVRPPGVPTTSGRWSPTARRPVGDTGLWAPPKEVRHGTDPNGTDPTRHRRRPPTGP